MARTSLSAAKAELFALLSSATGVPTVSGITAAYDHDPGPLRGQGPIAMTVTTAGIGPDDWVFAIRLYANYGSDPKKVQADLDSIMPAITSKVTDHFGPENWVGPNQHPDREDVLVCEWLVTCGRED